MYGVQSKIVQYSFSAVELTKCFHLDCSSYIKMSPLSVFSYAVNN